MKSLLYSIENLEAGVTNGRLAAQPASLFGISGRSKTRDQRGNRSELLKTVRPCVILGMNQSYHM